MPLQAIDWSVVVVGRWNRAILTPQGIITRLFGKPEGTQFGLEVPVDAIGPYRVVHDDLVVMADSSRLMVEIQQNSYDGLSKAMRIARKAMSELPETPFIAAGYNVCYQGNVSDECCGPLMTASQHAWDASLNEAGFPVTRRAISRTAEWEGGKILVTLSQDSDDVRLAFNFERGGNDAEMKAWLEVSVDDIRTQVGAICTSVLQLRQEALP